MIYGSGLWHPIVCVCADLARYTEYCELHPHSESLRKRYSTTATPVIYYIYYYICARIGGVLFNPIVGADKFISNAFRGRGVILITLAPSLSQFNFNMPLRRRIFPFRVAPGFLLGLAASRSSHLINGTGWNFDYVVFLRGFETMVHSLRPGEFKTCIIYRFCTPCEILPRPQL